MVKRASAYLRENRIFIQADSRTTAGLWIATGPVASASHDDPQEISRLLIACLDASKDGVPHPKEWAGFLKPFLSAVGVRSWKAFVKGAKHVRVSLDTWVVTFKPYRNDGAKDGFTPMSDKARSVPQASADLGRELLAAFAEAE
jgi:hypothetical protein